MRNDSGWLYETERRNQCVSKLKETKRAKSNNTFRVLNHSYPRFRLYNRVSFGVKIETCLRRQLPVFLSHFKYKYKSKKKKLNINTNLKKKPWAIQFNQKRSSTRIPVIVEQSWTPITREVLIYLACRSSLFFLIFLAFQRSSTFFLSFPYPWTLADFRDHRDFSFSSVFCFSNGNEHSIPNSNSFQIFWRYHTHS